MMNWKRNVFIAGLSAAAISVGAISAVMAGGQTLNGQSVPVEAPMTQAAMRQMTTTPIGSIMMPNGYFVRTNNPGTFSPGQIAHSKAEALNNPNIKEIILSYGTFVKSTMPNTSQSNAQTVVPIHIPIN